MSLSSEGKICIHYGNKKEYIKAGKKVVFYPDDKRFKKGKIRITSDKKITLQHLKRGYGTPSYTGNIELVKTAEGIVIINELPVEEYLKAVVPSEMPASYELEQKWQAWIKAGALCSEMETASLYTVSSVLGLKAAAVLLVVWNQEKEKKGLPQETDFDVNKEIFVAIKALSNIIKGR